MAGNKVFSKSRRGALKLRLRVTLLSVFFLSIYISLFAGAVRGSFFSVSPFKLFLYSVEHGFSLQTFFVVLSLFLIILVIYTLLKPAGEPSFHPIDTNRTVSPSDNYGRSDFEKPWQYRSLAQIRPIEECVGHIYGMLDERGRECVDFFPDPDDPASHLNSHIFAIGASGSGKTFTIGKTYCYQSIKLGHSVIHTDPKGELYTDLADIYSSHGYIVRRLNFNTPHHSDGWDCLKSLREETDPLQVELKSDRFATAVVSQIYTDPASIYYQGAVMLLKALLLRLVLDDSLPPSDKNIRTIYMWLTDVGGMTFLDALFRKDLMAEKLRPCLSPWSTFKGASANLAGNLIINLAAGITVLSSGIIADILSTDDIDLQLPCTDKCAYFIQFPVPNTAFCFPVALFFTMLFDTFESYAFTMPGHTLPRKVDCMLDEFAQCGIFPYWDQRMSVFRSYGISVFMIVQTLTQFNHLYRDAADTIISNCATWLMLGTNDQPSAEMFSKRIGQTTIEVRSESGNLFTSLFSKLAGSDRRFSVGTGRTFLLTADEIMKLPPNTLIILMQRHNPIWANAVPHTLHPYSNNQLRANKYAEYYFYDSENIRAGLPVRIERSTCEKAFIRRYNEFHDDFSPPPDIKGAPYSHAGDSLLWVIADLLASDISFWKSLILRKRKMPSCKTDISHDSDNLSATDLLFDNSIPSDSFFQAGIDEQINWPYKPASNFDNGESSYKSAVSASQEERIAKDITLSEPVLSEAPSPSPIRFRRVSDEEYSERSRKPSVPPSKKNRS